MTGTSSMSMPGSANPQAMVLIVIAAGNSIYDYPAAYEKFDWTP